VIILLVLVALVTGLSSLLLLWSSGPVFAILLSPFIASFCALVAVLVASQVPNKAAKRLRISLPRRGQLSLLRARHGTDTSPPSQ
jgi:hypothetical protein